MIQSLKMMRTVFQLVVFSSLRLVIAIRIKASLWSNQMGMMSLKMATCQPTTISGSQLPRGREPIRR